MRLLLLLVVGVVFSGELSAQSRAAVDDARELFSLSGAEFRELPQAHEPLQADALDLDLLAAAVYHETNRIRLDQRLTVLAFYEDAAEAARLQSQLMAEAQKVRHENPQHEELRTLQDRVARAGMRPAFAGENVASAFLLRYESGEPFYIREQNGIRVFSRSPERHLSPPGHVLTDTNHHA